MQVPVTQADAKTACANYTDKVKLQPWLARTILGVYVQDTFHGSGWRSILLQALPFNKAGGAQLRAASS